MKFPFSFRHGKRDLTVHNSAWGGPVCVDSDGEPVELSDAVAKSYESALKLSGLLAKKELIESGNAGVNEHGVIVDRRTHPRSVKLPNARKEKP